MTQPEPMVWDEVVDLLIVGSGAGSIVAGLVARDHGLKPLIVEKLPVVGGTTALSGGVIWIPNNPLMAKDGVPDSYERARTHMDAAIRHNGPGTSPHRREAFLRAGPDVVDYLIGKGMKFVRPKFWPDYHCDIEGGEQTSRSLEPQIFDLNQLGGWKQHFAGTRIPVMRFNASEAFCLSLVKRSWAARKLAIKIGFRYLYNALTGKDLRGMGAALQGRLLHIALKENISIWRNAPVEKLLTQGGRVLGAQLKRDGKPCNVRAERGVILNAGGFAKNAEMRERYGRKPVYVEFSRAGDGDTGEMIQQAIELGAATDCMDEGLWGVSSMQDNGDFPGGSVGIDGKPAPGHHLDISLPHCIMVDQNGQRFTNEAASYVEVGQRLYQRNEETGGRAIPAWAIIESRHRRRYPWGMNLGKAPRSWYDSGYLKQANTLEELAEKCGIDPVGLRKTIERFNRFCETGVDEDFNRGGKAFDHCHGDPAVKPNPNLGAIAKPPFYAVAIYPGDVSTYGGVVTDEHGRVLDRAGRPIAGLYATGTTTASVCGRSYLGAGASIGPAMVFGYLAARHLVSAGSDEAASVAASARPWSP